MRNVALVIFLFISEVVAAQNLIPNPSFEILNEEVEFAGSPYEYGWSWGDINLIKPWFNPTYHGAGIISNQSGSAAHTGCVAIRLLLLNRTTEYAYNLQERDYVSVQLHASLKKDSLYRFTMYVRRMENNIYAVDRIGVYFSKDSILNDTLRSMLNVKPQIEHEPKVLLYNKNEEWIKIEADYRASGGERFITIGNFYGNKETKYKNVNKKGRYASAYYDIDDISLIPLFEKTADSIVENDSSHKNQDTIRGILSEVLFKFNDHTLDSNNLVALQEVFRILEEYPKASIKLVGYTDNIGSPEYNLKLSGLRAKAVFDYLKSNGISAHRMSYSGMGEKNPIGDNQTNEGRKANRRVEYIITLK